MTNKLTLLLLLLFSINAAACASIHHGKQSTQPTAPAYDLVIYGATSAGISAAVQAERMGLSVVVVGPDKHLGGLSASGLGWTDSGNKAVIGGIALEFYKRIYTYYDKPEAWKWQDREAYGKRGEGTRAIDGEGRAMWVFEPHIAERVFEDLVREHNITVHREQWLDRSGGGVTMENGHIVSIKMLSGKTYQGKVFIDATYEGDLMAAAGVTYTVGREASSQYNETLNGVQIDNARKHQFESNISAYNIPGDPTSGLLPRISPDPPGIQGQGDKKVQAYNFRMCLTRNPENRVPFPKPDGYDASQYELLLRTLQSGARHIQGKFDMMPNLKTDTNNHGSFSTDNIGMNYDYPEASHERRAEIVAEHRRYQQGYCWFLANDPRVPQDVREWYSQWGLAKDEFLDNGHWPHQIYVREARRMVGDLVVTENHLRRKIETKRSIGMGSYNMDSHNVQRYVTADGFVRNEGDIQIKPGGPYPIDYGAILPKQNECDNLLAVCAVSSSHIAYGSIRMEPVFMILGQSASTAAAQAIESSLAVQAIDYDKLANRLKADGQVLAYTRPSGSGRAAPSGASGAVKLEGVVVDDVSAKLDGDWQRSSSAGPYIGVSYLHDGNADKGARRVTYTAKLKPARYEVRVVYSPNPNRATNTPITITHAHGEKKILLSQRDKPANGSAYASLGAFDFEATGTLVISNSETDGYVVADAVMFVPVKK